MLRKPIVYVGIAGIASKAGGGRGLDGEVDGGGVHLYIVPRINFDTLLTYYDFTAHVNLYNDFTTQPNPYHNFINTSIPRPPFVPTSTPVLEIKYGLILNIT